MSDQPKEGLRALSMKRLCCIVALLLAIVSCFAQQQRTLTETEKLSGIKMLKLFIPNISRISLNGLNMIEVGLNGKFKPNG